MKRSRKLKRRSICLWKIQNIKNAIPLVSSILLTIRENFIQINSIDSNLKRECGKTRHVLINMQNLEKDKLVAESNLIDALKELEDMGILCYDPICAVAFFAFNCNNGYMTVSAMFYYSPFGNEAYWRYDGDPKNTKRSTSLLEGY